MVPSVHRLLLRLASEPNYAIKRDCFRYPAFTSTSGGSPLFWLLGAMEKRQVFWLTFGFVFAPIVNGLAWLLLNSIFFNHSSNLDDTLSTGYMVSLFTAPFIIIIGVPSLALAHHFKFVRWWVAACVGLLSGAWLAHSMLNINGSLLVLYALIGATPALFIWWCWHCAYNHMPVRRGT